jgi:hypothetical protein
VKYRFPQKQEKWLDAFYFIKFNELHIIFIKYLLYNRRRQIEQMYIIKYILHNAYMSEHTEAYLPHARKVEPQN